LPPAGAKSFICVTPPTRKPLQEARRPKSSTMLAKMMERIPNTFGAEDWTIGPPVGAMGVQAESGAVGGA